MAIYQARFIRYLSDRGLTEKSESRVWAFLGDGECDEPETLGCISLAGREKMGHLCFVINCNLQRLDGPVRGNGKIIQELEGIFRGAGWNVVKVIWAGAWDAILAKDTHGILARRLGEIVDGQYQEYVVKPAAQVREQFANSDELRAMLADVSDDELKEMFRSGRGGHDPEKVYSAYKAAVDCTTAPTVILVKTVKGYHIRGEGGEGKNTTHQYKTLKPDQLRAMRDALEIPVSDAELENVPYIKPGNDSPEMRYMFEQRSKLGGFQPSRRSEFVPCNPPRPESFGKLYEATEKGKGRSTTLAWVTLMGTLMRDPEVGKLIVPIVPDEGQTFGMPPLYKTFGVYSSVGQLYEPVDKNTMTEYRESRTGAILQEGINEAGSMASFIAAGTAYSTHGVNTIPFYIYYSMFGFQRVGDLIWAAADSRCKGFLLGATAGRTTLNGEGLQHQDGHSLLAAMTVPSCRAYDPAFQYELAAIIEDGIHKMYVEGVAVFYYLTVYNEAYDQPPMPEGTHDGIIKGIYKFRDFKPEGAKHTVQLLGSGVILTEVLRAAGILADKYKVASSVYSVTSYQELRRDAIECERWNRLHPTQPAKKAYVQEVLGGTEGPIIASSDHMRTVHEQVAPYLDGRMLALGTDGFGRSETRPMLRRFFEIDAESVVVATLYALAEQGKLDRQVVADAIREFGIDPELPPPWHR